VNLHHLVPSLGVLHGSQVSDLSAHDTQHLCARV
jgi:hypothetical protein